MAPRADKCRALLGMGPHCSLSAHPWPATPPGPLLASLALLLQAQDLLRGSPLLRKAQDILSASAASWQELEPVVRQARQDGLLPAGVRLDKVRAGAATGGGCVMCTHGLAALASSQLAELLLVPPLSITPHHLCVYMAPQACCAAPGTTSVFLQSLSATAPKQL